MGVSIKLLERLVGVIATATCPLLVPLRQP